MKASCTHRVLSSGKQELHGLRWLCKRSQGTSRICHVSLLTVEDHLVGKGQSVMWVTVPCRASPNERGGSRDVTHMITSTAEETCHIADDKLPTFKVVHHAA